MLQTMFSPVFRITQVCYAALTAIVPTHSGVRLRFSTNWKKRIMGFIAEHSRKKSVPLDPSSSRNAWRATFGGGPNQGSSLGTTKEGTQPLVDNGTGRSRTLAAGGTAEAGFKRLLQAFRSNAPGGWSDHRWEQSQHYVGIAYVAIHRCSEQMAQAECKVYQKDSRHPDGKRPVYPGEQGYELAQLLEKPNEDDSLGDMLYQWNMQMDLTGSALTWVVPNALQRPMELYPIATCLALPGPIVTEDYPKGYYQIQPIYPYGPFTTYPSPLSAVGTRIPSEWMVRFKYPHPYLRYDGYSPMTAMRHHLDQIESIDSSRWYSMKRLIKPSAVLNMDDMEGSFPLPEEEIDRIKAEFETSQMGPDNSGQLFVSYPGAKLEQWGNRPIDMEFQQGWDQLSSFLLGAFGITKPAAGMVEDSSYSTLYATLKQLYWLTLEPKCRRFSSQLTRRLAPYFGDGLIVEITTKRIDDHDVKLAKLSFLMSAKAITKNEARKECEFPLTQEMWGNEVAGEPPLIPIGIDPLTGQPIASEMAAQGMLPPPDQDGVISEDEEQEQYGNDGEENTDDLLNLVPAEISRERPTPGMMGRGAQGSRTQGYKKKSFHDQVKEAVGVNGCLTNGA